MMRYVVFGCAVAAAVGLAVFGATSSTTTTPTTTARTTAPTVLVLTGSADRTTVVASRGGRVEVRLAPTAAVHWSEASVTSGPWVLVRTSGRIAPDGASVTTFAVVGSGTAELGATGRPVCSGVCPDYVLGWEVTLEVPAGTARGRRRRPAASGVRRARPTGGRSSTSWVDRARWMPPSTPVTAVMGMATCLRPHR